MAASDSILKELHEAVAKELLEIIKEGVPCKWDEESGDVLAMRKPTAAEFSAAIAFLKANDVTANLDDTEHTKALRDALDARRRKVKPVMPDYLDDHGGVH